MATFEIAYKGKAYIKANDFEDAVDEFIKEFDYGDIYQVCNSETLECKSAKDFSEMDGRPILGESEFLELPY